MNNDLEMLIKTVICLLHDVISNQRGLSISRFDQVVKFDVELEGSKVKFSIPISTRIFQEEEQGEVK